MLKFVGDGEEGPVVGLGLSRINTEKIQEGKPILVNLKDLGFDKEEQKPPKQILIFFCETEKEGMRKMRQMGLVNDDTEQNIPMPPRKPS